MEGTITQALENAARISDRGLTFIGDDGGSTVISYPELHRRAEAVGAALQADGLKVGDAIALILPDAQDFIVTFFGSLCAGVVPVPLYPPLGLGKIAGYLQSSKHVVKAARARRVVTTSQIRRLLGTVQEAAPECTAVLDVNDLRGDAASFRRPQITPEHRAFIQFTSGSTARPKGVVLSHANLDANAHAIMARRARVGRPRTTRRLVAAPVPRHGADRHGPRAADRRSTPVVYMPTLSFLKRPRAWLEAITRHRGTISFAPNFAYGRVREARAARERPRGPRPVRVAGRRLRRRADPGRRPSRRSATRSPRRASGRDALAAVLRHGRAHAGDLVRTAREGPSRGRPRSQRRALGPLAAEPGDEDAGGRRCSVVVAAGGRSPATRSRIVDEEGEMLPERAGGRDRSSGDRS